MASLHHSPERRAWKGRSYKRISKRVRALREAARWAKWHPDA